MSENEGPWLRNAFRDAQDRDTRLAMAGLALFLSAMGIWALVDGEIPAAIFLFASAVLLPAIVLILQHLDPWFSTPAQVRVLGDGALLRRSGGKIRRIAWEEVRTPIRVRTFEHHFLRGSGEAIQFKVDKSYFRMFVDTSVTKVLMRSFQSWCSEQGLAEGAIVREKTFLQRIIAGEGRKIRGYGYIASGLSASLIVLIPTYLFVGILHVVFLIMAVMAFSWLGLSVFFGLAEIRGEARYVKYGLIALFSPLWSLVVVLTIVDVFFLTPLILLLVGNVLAYVQVWRKIPKAERSS